MGFFECFQRWYAVEKLDELWRIEYNLIEKNYIQPVQLWGIDAGHKVLQVIADPFERKNSENREDRACQGRWVSAFLVREGFRGLEPKDQTAEESQRGEGGGYRIGWNIPRWGIL